MDTIVLRVEVAEPYLPPPNGDRMVTLQLVIMTSLLCWLLVIAWLVMSVSRVADLAKFYPPDRAPLKPATLQQATNLPKSSRGVGELYSVGILSTRGLVWRPASSVLPTDDASSSLEEGTWKCVACNHKDCEWVASVDGKSGAVGFGHSTVHWKTVHAKQVCLLLYILDVCLADRNHRNLSGCV